MHQQRYQHGFMTEQCLGFAIAVALGLTLSMQATAANDAVLIFSTCLGVCRAYRLTTNRAAYSRPRHQVAGRVGALACLPDVGHGRTPEPQWRERLGTGDSRAA